MSTDPGSLEKAVQDAVEDGEQESAIGAGMFGAETTAQQLDLLRDPGTGELPANVFPMVRSRGRPPNSRNKRNEKVATLIVQKHGDPVMELASLGFMPLDQMVEAQVAAAGLGSISGRLDKMIDDISTRLKDKDLTSDQAEALENLSDKAFAALNKLISKRADFARHAMTVKKDALVQSGPYVHGKQPIAVNVTGKADLILNIEGISDALELARHAEVDEFNEDDFKNIAEAKFVDVRDAPDDEEDGADG